MSQLNAILEILGLNPLEEIEDLPPMAKDNLETAAIEALESFMHNLEHVKTISDLSARYTGAEPAEGLSIEIVTEHIRRLSYEIEELVSSWRGYQPDAAIIFLREEAERRQIKVEEAEDAPVTSVVADYVEALRAVMV